MTTPRVSLSSSHLRTMDTTLGSASLSGRAAGLNRAGSPATSRWALRIPSFSCSAALPREAVLDGPSPSMDDSSTNGDDR
eukprot:CAMPEP_0182613604 /NCGR_PEP_ID=MMETSP1330-20130603/26327_1 /TAXON_ID=464278 /ORGANISM="Picochlorum sp., Strain RCC944" /LENGTH=79 /DNA_ID=CAMNT_0024833331 /DNA_START=121 /DNA_END=363 /DNA_ORIENTATION=+